MAVRGGTSRMGIYRLSKVLQVFGDALTDPVLELEEITYYTVDNRHFQQEMDQLRQDTDLWVEEGDFLMAFLRDGEYISQAEYEALNARYKTPEDPAIQMQQTSQDNPVPPA